MMITSWSTAMLFNFRNPEKSCSGVGRTVKILQMGWEERGLPESVGTTVEERGICRGGGEVEKPLLEIKSGNNAGKIRGERWERGDR